MPIFPRLFLSGILYLLSIGIGVWLGLSGKPYGTVLFTVHKLLALAASVFIVLAAVGMLKEAGTVYLLLPMVIAAVAILALFATGALLSTWEASYRMLRITHIALVILLVGSLGWTAWQWFSHI